MLLPCVFSRSDVIFLCVIVLGVVQIREELRANGIDVYPQKEFDEDAEDRMINDKIRVSSQRGVQSVQILLFVSCSFLLFFLFWEGKKSIVASCSVKGKQPKHDPKTNHWEHLNDCVHLCVCLHVCTQQEMIPFAVVGSDQEYQVNGKRILGRKTKWGTIEGNTHES